MATYKNDLSNRSDRFEYVYRAYNRMGVPLIPLILSLPVMLIISYFLFKMQNFWLCNGLESCIAWGSFTARAILIAIFCVPFLTIVIERFFLYRYNLKNYLSINVLFLKITFLLMLVGLFIFFNVFTVTTATYLEVGDINHLGLINSLKLPYKDISGVGSTVVGSPTNRYNYCRLLPYVVTQQNQIILLYGALNDYSLVQYLQQVLHISNIINISEKNQCGFISLY